MMITIEIENTWFKQNDFKAGVAYQTEKFQSDLRFSMSETEVGIPHMEEGHDDHGEEDHYQEINHTTLTWKNTFDMGNDHTLDITLGRQLNERKEFGGHEEEGHDDHEDHEEEGHDDHDVMKKKVMMIMTIMRVMRKVKQNLTWNLKLPQLTLN